MNQYFDNDLAVTNQKKIINVTFNNKTYKLYTNNGVFSKDKLDYGSKLLLETMIKENLTGKILDLGCGYGAIGVILATTFPQITVDMIDITDRAVELSRKNVQKLNLKNISVLKSNIYEQVSNKYDYIITNPPIRAGKDMIRKFLIGAKEHLKTKGELWFVMRKDHGVKSIIKELEQYYKISIETKSKGFYIVKCAVE